eukprot:TRINITY_DN12080_c0_g1_i1.p1 TRINITY_DN12080_c0_g1~~TRINITY_DN12080_c0_g1_i1.p1  ORF type:complete len:434 (-),score=124.54 TRINITY_DN12080_c0_g1_i1:125-1426(-)
MGTRNNSNGVDEFESGNLLNLKPPKVKKAGSLRQSSIKVNPSKVDPTVANLGLATWSMPKLQSWAQKHMVGTAAVPSNNNNNNNSLKKENAVSEEEEIHHMSSSGGSRSRKYSLDLTRARLTEFGFHSLARALIHDPILMHCISTIKLVRVGLEDSAVSVLALAIANNKNITALDLECNHIGPKGTEVLSEALAKAEAIRFLNISHNPIEDLGCVFLQSALESLGDLRQSSFRCLHAYHCGFSVDMGLALLETLCLSRFIQCIELGMCQMGDEALRIVADSLASGKNLLSSVRLIDCWIRDEGLKYLADVLVSCKNDNRPISLLELNLQDNHISSQGLEQFVRSTSPDIGMRICVLSGNNLDDECESLLMELAARNPLLQILDVEHTRISPEIQARIHALENRASVNDKGNNSLNNGTNDCNSKRTQDTVLQP